MLSKKSLYAKWQEAVDDGEEDRDFESFYQEYKIYTCQLELENSY